LCFILLLIGNLSEAIQKARIKAASIGYSEPVLIGDLSDFLPSDLEMIDAKVMVRNDKILLIECPYTAHECIGVSCLANMQTQLKRLTDQLVFVVTAV
jgi:hypothetical protein